MVEPCIQQVQFFPVTTGVTTPIANLTTASVQVMAASNQRKKITFHNPMTVANIDVIVCPALSAAAAAISATFAAPAGGYVIFPGNSISFEGDDAGGAWKAAAASGTTGSLTISTSNRPTM